MNRLRDSIIDYGRQARCLLYHERNLRRMKIFRGMWRSARGPDHQTEDKQILSAGSMLPRISSGNRISSVKRGKEAIVTAVVTIHEPHKESKGAHSTVGKVLKEGYKPCEIKQLQESRLHFEKEFKRKMKAGHSLLR